MGFWGPRRLKKSHKKYMRKIIDLWFHPFQTLYQAEIWHKCWPCVVLTNIIVIVNRILFWGLGNQKYYSKSHFFTTSLNILPNISKTVRKSAKVDGDILKLDEICYQSLLWEFPNFKI